MIDDKTELALRRRDELISCQAMKIFELQKENADKEEILDKIHLMLVCIGGPLNDNYHKYSKEQLKVFFDIARLIEA